MTKISDLCGRCGKYVYHAERKVALDKVWHETCFTCVTCKRTLSTYNFSSHQGELYCKPCCIRGSVYGFALPPAIVRSRSGGPSPKPSERIEETSNIRPSDIKNAVQKRRQTFRPESDDSLSNSSEDHGRYAKNEKKCLDTCPSVRKLQDKYDLHEDKDHHKKRVSKKVKNRGPSDERSSKKSKKHLARRESIENDSILCKSPIKHRNSSGDSAYDTENYKNPFRKLYDKLLPLKCPNCDCHADPIESTKPETPKNTSSSSSDERNNLIGKKLNRHEANLNISDDYKRIEKKHREKKQAQQKQEVLFTSESGTVQIVKITKPKHLRNKSVDTDVDSSKWKRSRSRSAKGDNSTNQRYTQTAVKKNSQESWETTAWQETPKRRSKNEETLYKICNSDVRCNQDACNANKMKPLVGESVQKQPLVNLFRKKSRQSQQNDSDHEMIPKKGRRSKNEETLYKVCDSDVQCNQDACNANKMKPAVGESVQKQPLVNLFRKKSRQLQPNDSDQQIVPKKGRQSSVNKKPNKFEDRNDNQKTKQKIEERCVETTCQDIRRKRTTKNGKKTRRNNSKASLENSPLPDLPPEKKTRLFSPRNIFNRLMRKTNPETIEKTPRKPQKKPSRTFSNENHTKERRSSLKDNNNHNKTKKRFHITEKPRNSKETTAQNKKQLRNSDANKKIKKEPVEEDFAPQVTSTPARRSPEKKKPSKRDEFASVGDFNTPITYTRPKADNFTNKNIKNSVKKKNGDRTVKPEVGNLYNDGYDGYQTAEKVRSSKIRPRAIPRPQHILDSPKRLRNASLGPTIDKKQSTDKKPLKFSHLHSEEDFFEPAIRNTNLSCACDSETKFRETENSPNKKKSPARMSSGAQRFVVTAEISPKKNIIRDFSAQDNRIVTKSAGLLKNPAVQKIIEKCSPGSENSDDLRLCSKVRKGNCVFGRLRSGKTSKIVHPSTVQILFTPVASLPETPTDGVSSFDIYHRVYDKFIIRHLKNLNQQSPRDICSRCNEQVFLTERKIAAERVFHKWCFTCFACKKSLDSMNLLTRKNEIYCRRCYMQLFGPRIYGYGAGYGLYPNPPLEY